MIGIANPDPLILLLLGLVAWAVLRSLHYARPWQAYLDRRTYRWTISDWFDLTFWLAVALAAVRAVGSQ